MKKYDTSIYSNVKWRHTLSGKIYKKLMHSNSILGRLYTATFRAPVHSNIKGDILRYFRKIKGTSNVLDIGGNIGSFEDERIKKTLSGAKYLRLDIDPESKPDILADAKKIPKNNNSIDFAICKSVLEHIDEPSRVVDEIHRVLRKGGLFYFYIPFFQRVHASPNDYQRFTSSGIRFLLRKFRKVEIKSNGGYFSSLSNLLFIGTYFLDNLIGIGIILRIILWPILRLIALLDKFDKYQLTAIGYYGLAQK